MYGICALESCRARQYNLFEQRQRQTVRVGRRRETNSDDLGTRDRDPLVDGVHQVCLLLQYICDESLADRWGLRSVPNRRIK